MNRLQIVLERITLQWWFYLVLIVLFMLPSYTEFALDARNTADLIAAVLSQPLVYSYPVLFPIFKIIPIILIAGLFIYTNKAAALFIVYSFVLIMILAILQNSAMTQDYGFSVLSGNVIVYLLVAFSWLLELFTRQSDFSKPNRSRKHYWIIPLAMLAFWFPVNDSGLATDFSFIALFGNSAGLTTCMMLPVLLTVLYIYSPRVNPVTLRITAFAGLITGLLNVMQWFVLTDYWLLGVLHLPLLIISALAFASGITIRSHEITGAE